MKKLLLIVLCSGAIGLGAQPVSAAIMMGSGFDDDDDHTAKEEAEGKAIWAKLKTDELTCAELETDDFERIGEYFMGLMMGSSHAAMNQMMVQTMGEDGEEAMHEVMGKRISACDPSAVLPATATGFMPMMQMMSGGYNGYSSSMMGNWGYGVMSWGLMILWWVLIIVAIIALVKWLVNQSHSSKK